MPHLNFMQWLLAAVAAVCVGIGKAGISGMGLLPVVIFAFIFGARTSTGIVLPMLIVGDVSAVRIFHQHARWDYIRRMLPPACIGVVAAALTMSRISDATFKPLIGAIVLTLAVLQAARLRWPNWMGAVPHTRPAVWVIGLIAGGATMLANAAGPVVSLYCVAVGLPKFEVVGTLAWFFLIVNVFKLPFSAGLGLIRADTLFVTAVLLPAVLVGVFSGRWIVHRLPQRVFDVMLIAFAVIAALRLILG